MVLTSSCACTPSFLIDPAAARLFLFSSKWRSTASRLSFLTSFFSCLNSSFTAPLLLWLMNLEKLSVLRFMASGVKRFYWQVVRRRHRYPFRGCGEVWHSLYFYPGVS